jgi:hypothetical protein
LVAAPESEELVRKVAGRSPAPTPLAYDADLGALIQWPPLDVRLPALAETPEALRERLAAAGVEFETPDEVPEVVKHRPLTGAVLSLDRYIAKVSGDGVHFARALYGLAVAPSLPVRSAGFKAVVPDLRITVQSLVRGDRPAGAAEVAAQAGGLLAKLHAADVDGLPLQTPADRLSTVVPHLRPRLDDLLGRLERSKPEDRLVTSHGGFHLSQLLESNGDLAVIDFDGICHAQRARDLASYLVSLVETKDDLEAATATYETLSDGYGSRPPGVSWYLSTLLVRRARRPFTRLREGWREQVETRVAAAESALDLDL